MSSHIDENVVELKFDNSHFEKNAEKSMTTLDKLKKSLDFEGSSKGLDEVVDAGNRIDFNNATKSAGKLSSAFSALEIAGVTALVNISNRATNMGMNLIKSMSGIEMFTSGWNKFGEMTRSVGTLVSQGFAEDKVYDQLEKLNWFTDETSYNLTSMVDSIGKFTATGRDLDDCVTAMIGIADWAAISGQNASTASRAMYQLSQALSAGYMRKEDYKSIQNLNMDTEEFRKTAIATAIELGTLQKIGEDTFQSLRAETDPFSTSQFAEHLTEDAWFTADVMMEVYKKYSKAIDQIYDYTITHENMTTSEAIEQLEGSVDEFSLKAFRAGQEARTFADAIDSVKDAASTGWSTTFQLIFGEYSEAKQIWTDLANDLYDIFVEGGNIRNTWLGELMSKSIDSVSELLSKFGSANSKISQAFEAITPPVQKATKALETLDTMVDKVLNGEFGNGHDRYLKLTEAGYNYYQIQNKVNETLGDSFRYADEIVKKRDEEIASTDKINAKTTKTVEAKGQEVEVNKELIKSLGQLSDEELKSQGYTQDQIDALHTLRDEADKLGMTFDDFIDNVENINGRWILLDSFQNLIEIVSNIVSIFREVWAEVFPPERSIAKIYDLIAGFHKFTEQLKLGDEEASNLHDILKGLFTIIRILGDAVLSLLKIINPVVKILKPILNIVGSILAAGGRALAFVGKIADELELVGVAVNEAYKAVKTAFKASPIGKKLYEWQTALNNVKTTLKGIFEIFTFGVNESPDLSWAQQLATSGVEKVGKIFAKIAEYVTIAGESVANFFKNLRSGGTGVGGKVAGIINSLTQYFKMVGDVAGSALDKVQAFFNGLDFSKININTDASFGRQLLEILQSAVSGGLLAVLVDMAKTFRDLEKLSVKGSFVAVLDTLRGTLKAYQTELKAEALKSIGIGLLAIAGALLALSFADERGLENATASLMMVGLVVGGIMFALAKVKEASSQVNSVDTLTNSLKHFISGLRRSVELVAAGIALQEIAIAMGIITLAIIGLSRAISKDPKAIEDAMWYMVAIFAAIEIFTVTMAKVKMADIAKVGTVLVSFATAMGLMVTAMVALSKATVDEDGNDVTNRLLTAAGIMLAFFGGLVAIVAILAKAKEVSVKMEGMAMMFIGISVAVMILAKALEKFVDLAGTENIDAGFKMLLKTLAMVGAVGMMLGGVKIGPIRAGGGNIAGAAVAFVGISASMLIFAKAVEKFGNLPGQVLVQGVSTVGLLMASIGALSNLTDGKSMAITAASLLIFAAAINAIVMPITILGSLSLETIGKGILAITGAFIGFAIAGALLAPAALAIKQLGIGFLAFAGGLWLISSAMSVAALGIGAFALAFAAAMPAIILALKALIAGITELIPLIVNQAVNIFVGVLQGIEMKIDTIAALLIEILIKILDVLSTRMEPLTEKLLECLIGLINGLTAKVPDLGSALLELFEAVFGWVFQAIGTLIGDMGEGMTDALPAMGENLAGFMDNAKTFFDGVKTIGNDTLQGALLLAEVVAAMAGSGMIDGLGELLNIKTGYAELGEQLNEFAPYLVEFAQTVGELTPDQVGKMFLAAEAAKALTEVAKNIPNDGGLWGAIAGENDAGSFGSSLEGLADGLVTFATKTASVDLSTVSTACDSLNQIIEMASSIPNSGGLWGLIAGDNDMDDFGTALTQLGEGVMSFNERFKGADFSGLDSGISAVYKVIDMCKNMPTQGGLASLLDDKSMGTFGRNLKNLGSGITDFADTVNDIKSDDLAVAEQAFLSVAKMVNSVDGLNFEALKVFDDALSKAGVDGVNKFIEAFDTHQNDVEDAGSNFVNKLVSGLNSKAGSSGITTAGKSLGSKALSSFKTTADGYSGGVYFVQGVVNGITAKTSSVYWAGYSLGQTAYRGQMDGQDSHSPSKLAEKGGKFYTQGYILGIKDNISGVYSAGYDISQAAVDAIRDPLKMLNAVLADELNVDPVIRPTLDLSDVQHGSSYLASMLNDSSIRSSLTGDIGKGRRANSSDVVSAINSLAESKGVGNTYQINGINYSEGSDVAEAIETIVRAARVGGRA